MYLLDVRNIPIFEQLRIEEALLRGTDLNVCLINWGSPRAIVMGISGRPELLLDLARVDEDKIPVIRRFSGGGTVVIDEDTIFVTFICGKNAVEVAPFPEPILRWSGELYTKSWQIPNFQLIENDYAIGALKCGGNAQYIQKNRWLHHTSFLWDYAPKNMEYLLLPEKRPRYRQDRHHADFLSRLKHHAVSKEHLIRSLVEELQNRFEVVRTTLDEVQWTPHRQSVYFVK